MVKDSQGENQDVTGNDHDPLCRYQHDSHLARYDCGECNLIDRTRADERAKPLNFIPREICSSEAFMWIMTGSNHQDIQLAALRTAWFAYRHAGGGWGRLSTGIPSARSDPRDDK